MVYGYIYKIENLVNGKIYIGQTTQKPYKRKSHHFSHLKKNDHYNTHLQHAFNRYGKDNFKFTVLNYATNKITLDILERSYINCYNSLNKEKGYNLCEGGSNGKLSPQTRKKISEKNKGKIFTEKHRKRIGIASKGRTHSIQSRKKMSETRSGKNLSLNHRENVSKGHKGQGQFGFTGIFLHRKVNPEVRCWHSRIRYNNHRKSLGCFEDPLSAQIVYDFVFNEIYNIRGMNK
jgi:group I intron endonuclease